MYSTANQDYEKRSELFKALAHPIRLLIMNLIRTKPRHGEELALIDDVAALRRGLIKSRPLTRENNIYQRKMP